MPNTIFRGAKNFAEGSPSATLVKGLSLGNDENAIWPNVYGY